MTLETIFEIFNSVDLRESYEGRPEQGLRLVWGHDEVFWGHSHEELWVLIEISVIAFSVCYSNPGNNISLNFKAF